MTRGILIRLPYAVMTATTFDEKYEPFSKNLASRCVMLDLPMHYFDRIMCAQVTNWLREIGNINNNSYQRFSKPKSLQYIR